MIEAIGFIEPQVFAVSDATRLLVIADEAAMLQRPLVVRDLEALCYLLGADTEAGDLGCSYRYRFSPGPSSGEFETDLSQLEAAGYAEQNSPVAVSDRGRAWLSEESRAAGVERLREIAKRVLPPYLDAEDMVALSVTRSEKTTARALERDLRELQQGSAAS
jgi:hypothetical protein